MTRILIKHPVCTCSGNLCTTPLKSPGCTIWKNNPRIVLEATGSDAQYRRDHHMMTSEISGIRSVQGDYL